MKAGTIIFGQRRIGFSLEPATGKRLRIIITPKLEVRVRVPAGVGEGEVEAILNEKAAGIARRLERQERYHPLPGVRRYVSGETLLYLGRQYRLKVAVGPKRSARLRGRFLCVEVPGPGDRQAVQRTVVEWSREHAVQVFSRIGDKCFSVGARHGIPRVPLHVRLMRSRWGGCSKRERVTLNIQLVRAPTHCIEYVIMHELCHLVHHNHSQAFYRLLCRCMPDWEKRRAALAEVSAER